ncbi:MAG: response regulator, partial [Chroococcidiopsidaceae cyanobacterium CP_BM_ER_R8_30]|nr:response regulator [Chroococcidiopsidaceae cyanobacterium CP_BM_ER_R8_30]
MPTPTLYDFIATIPTCSETACLAEVIDIFTSRRCDLLMLVSEQHCPIGVVHLHRLIPHLIISTQWKNRGFQANRALSEIKQAIVDPLITIPAQLGGDQLDTYLHTHSATLKASLLEDPATQRSALSSSNGAPFAAQERKLNSSCDLALVDPEGKFLGLVDSVRLLRYLVTSRVMGTETGCENVEMRELDSLAQVLERLPWPLMLLTNKAEVVMQNPAWWQHFGSFSDPEAIRQEVEAILENSATSVGTGAQKAGEHSQGILAVASHPKKSREPRAGETDSAYARYPEVESLSEEDVLADDNDAEPAFATSKRCQVGTEPGTCTCVFAGQNGQERVWQFAKIPLMSIVTNRVDGEQIWLLLATDVTREQQLASELAAKNADLIHLNRLKDEFLACISHELKTPLTAVLGLSTLLEDQAMGQLNERQARYARLIHQSGRHLMTVVNDILDLTRMETGQLELTLQPVKISTVCDRAIQQVRSSQIETNKTQRSAGSGSGSCVEQAQKSGTSANPSNHQFTLSIEPGLDSCVADELRLRQMLVHLLANAFKFTETGGEIGLRVNRWEGWIAFTVWDTGIGIPEHQQHLIFQKFQQLENPLTRRFEGTGLGLVLTRALARLHGGDVSFLSMEGKGSQFTLLLPPSPPFKRAGGAGGAEEAGGAHSAFHPVQKGRYAPPTSGRIVLVVEAAPRFIENLTEQLNSLGYRFVIARSGTEALEKARRLQPRVILLNPFLPLLSGWDVLTLLKSDPATSQIAVIVTATRAEREQAFLNRADDFLSLPVQQQVLHQLLMRFRAETQFSPFSRDAAQSTQNEPLLTILRLVNSYPSPEETPYRLLQDAEHKENVGSATDQPPLKGMPVAAPATSLSKLNYRVLEADDLEQAELLARIWQPNVVLLDAQIPEPLAYFKQLSQQPSLKNLPIVTLEATTTQAANQVAGLAVFPCLTPIPNRSIHTLLPILEIAAGIGLKPSLLVVDVAT